MTQPFRKHKRVLIPVVAAVLALGTVGVLLYSRSDADQPSTPVPTSPAPTATAPTPPPDQPTADQPAGPDLTTSQEQAIRKAKQYLSFQAFSRKGLIDQLEFEGFSTDDATFAVDQLQVDWYEQAAKKAEQYLDLQAFSRKGLIDQLEFEGFTREQAEHGASAVGL